MDFFALQISKYQESMETMLVLWTPFSNIPPALRLKKMVNKVRSSKISEGGTESQPQFQGSS